MNRWDLWVYPFADEEKPGNVYITDKLDRNAEDILKKGGSVLFLTYMKTKSFNPQIEVDINMVRTIMVD